VNTRARAQLPEAGWDIRSRRNASPQLERNVERFTQFLTIVGLTALWSAASVLATQSRAISTGDASRLPP
jgi:putative ABC transport system permease protein